MRPPKPKPFPIRSSDPRLTSLLRSCVVILAVNWVFQAMRGMDRKELGFRVLLELLLFTVASLALLTLGLATLPAAIGAALLAHSINFTANGQVWVCARYCRWWRGDGDALERFARSAAQRLRHAAWLEEALVIGSFGRADVDGRSDLDLRLIFPEGLVAWLRTNLLLLELRARAFAAGIPLDLYAYDSPRTLYRFDQREPLAVLLDRAGRLQATFPDRVRTVP